MRASREWRIEVRVTGDSFVDQATKPIAANDSSPVASSERRHDLDWVRVIVVLLLFVFHSARVFDPAEPFYVWSEQKSTFLQHTVIGLFSQWAMPLLFLVSGSATWYALGKRNAGRYLRERVLRLLVPFVFGVLVIVPPQAYLALLDHGDPARSYPVFLGSYFSDWSDLSGYFGTFTPAHLWFIVFLLAYSIASLPLLLHLRSAAGRRWVERAAAWMAHPMGLWAVGIVFVLVAVLPDIAGKNPFLYLAYFLVGFSVVASDRPQAAFQRAAPYALALAVVTYGALVWLTTGDPRPESGSLVDAAVHVARHFGTWLWLVAILGFARRYLSFGHPLLARLNEASYPVYVLHQTVIVAVAYPVVRWGLPLAAQYVLIVLLSVGVTWSIYRAAVYPWNPVRALMGLKSLRATSTLPPVPPARTPVLKGRR